MMTGWPVNWAGRKSARAPAKAPVRAAEREYAAARILKPGEGRMERGRGYPCRYLAGLTGAS